MEELLDEDDVMILNLIKDNRMLSYSEINRKVSLSKNKVLFSLNKLISLNLIVRIKNNNKIFFKEKEK